MAKAMKTEVIRFNLKERMRQFNGVERKFDIPKLVAAINSDKVQERVRLGDLNGFYGHWARVHLGAEPQEGGLVDGKLVHLEPCCRTVYLKAFPDGTVEHQQEFFNTELGLKAWQRLQDKSGGFSSVISAKNGYDFHGFDYVNEPNYAANRGYTLDSVAEMQDEVMILDDLLPTDYATLTYLEDSLEIYQVENDRLRTENQLLADSLAHLQAENRLLLDDIVLAEAALERQQQAVKSAQKFDNATLDSVIAQANSFKTAKLEKTEEQAQEMQQFSERNKVNNFLKRYGL